MNAPVSPPGYLTADTLEEQVCLQQLVAAYADLAQRHGWENLPVVPMLLNLAGVLIAREQHHDDLPAALDAACGTLRARAAIVDAWLQRQAMQ